MSFSVLSPLSRREILSKRSLLLFHWFLCSVGLIGIIYGLSRKLYTVLMLRIQVTDYNEWVVPFFFSSKPQQLIFFITAGISLSVYYVLVYCIMRRQEGSSDKSYGAAEYWSTRFLFMYVMIPVISNALVYAWFRARNPVISVPSLLLYVLWLSILFLPFYRSRTRVKQRVGQVLDGMNQFAQGKVYRYALAGLLVLVCVQLFTIFLPTTRDRLFMMNEYMDIPERTWVDGEYVSNAEYINRHNLGGLLKYDPDVDKGLSPLPPFGSFLNLPKTELLEEFIKMNSTKYYYDDARHVLVIHGPMSIEELGELSAILSTEHKADLDSLYSKSNEQYDNLDNRIYTADELEFLVKNRLEMRWQILNRWIIHHHNFVLGPINEYALGKPLKDINAQYGSFNIVLMKYLLEKMGGISYQNYFEKWYLFWPFYYALFIAIVLLLFRNVHYVVLVCVLAFGFVNKIDYQFLLLGPGYNPFRHFFDIPVMAMLYFYLKTGKAWLLVAGFLFGLVGVLNNTQFGLLLIGALSTTVLVKALLEGESNSRRDGGLAVIALVASAIVVLTGEQGENSIAPYLFEGFFGLPVPTNQLVFIVLAISACYLVALLWGKMASELRYVTLFLLVYSQGVTLYYVWHGGDKHLFKVASILALGGVAFIRLIIEHSSVKRYEKALIGSLIAVALVTVYIPGLLSYYSTRQEYEGIFLTHRTYDWNLDTAKFRSTMDPRYFIDSVALIQEYVPSENAIHLISKYDNFLPFLAKKYSAMPFFDLQWFLLTDKEVQLCIERIKTNKPHYLFVDTDIERDLNGEIVTAELEFISGPARESLMRVQRLNLLKDIFAAVKNDYEPIKHGILLTVYRRKLTADDRHAAIDNLD